MKKVEELNYQELKSEASKRGVYKIGITVNEIKRAVHKHRDANPNFDLNAVASPKEKKAAVKKAVAKQPAKKAAAKKAVVKKTVNTATTKGVIVTGKKLGGFSETGTKPLNMTLLPAEDKVVKSDLSESIKIFVLVSEFKRTTDFTDKLFDTTRSKGLMYLLGNDKNRKDNMVKKYNDFKAKK